MRTEALKMGDGFHFASWQGIFLSLATVVGLNVLYTLLIAFYNLCFHPLRKFPGPKLWIAFPILRNLQQVQGKLDFRIRELHDKHGDCVRLEPDALSFTTARAWKDIYGHGHAELPKYFPPGSGMGGTPKIITANAPDHFRFRRAMLPAFSDKALGQQEPLIKVYVDLLIQRLNEVAASNQPADMVKWYNYTTFDLIGDLAYGESFNGLKENKPNEWIINIGRMMKMMPILVLIGASPLLSKVMLLFFSDKMKKSRQKHLDMANALTMKRIRNKDQERRGDFMDFMMRAQGQKHGLSDAELASNSDTLLVAGSETTATLLSGVTYNLLRNPEVLKKCTDEVRSAFATEEEISFRSASASLPYMLACLDEALRVFPPIPLVLYRKCLPGPPTPIDGRLIPQKTRVGVHQFSTYHSEKNFHRAREYIPERWLPQYNTDPSSPFANDNREAFKPFSFGPRDCIGRNLAYHEMRLILSRVLWNFDLTLSPECSNWHDQRVYGLWEKPPLMVSITRRARSEQ